MYNDSCIMGFYPPKIINLEIQFKLKIKFVLINANKNKYNEICYPSK